MQVKNIAIYIRLSLEDKDVRDNIKSESNSISNQRKLLLDFCNSNEELNSANITEFCDDGFTGTNFNRPKFKEMIEEIKLGLIDCVVVKDLSRFGRNYIEVGAYLEHFFPSLGIRFISINDRYDSNNHIGTTSGLDIALENLLYGLYSKDLSVKAKSGRQARAKNGEFIGYTAPYGYLKSKENKRKLEIDKEVEPIIKDIFSMCINGHSTREIARILNDKNILCPYEYKRSKGVKPNKPTICEKVIWQASTVRTIIKDERYIGNMVSNKYNSKEVGKNIFTYVNSSDWIIVEGTHEGIISKEDFILANESLKNRIKTINKNTSSKNNNLFVCGNCGLKLQKSSGKDKYLYCLTGKRDTQSQCSNININKSLAEDKVLDIVKNMVNVFVEKENIYLKKLAVAQSNIDKDIKQLNDKLEKLKNSKMELYMNYRNGKLSQNKFLELKKEQEVLYDNTNKILAEKKNELIKQNIDSSEKQGFDDKSIVFIKELESFNSKVISNFIEKVKIYDNEHIEVIFKNNNINDTLLHLNVETS